MFKRNLLWLAVLVIGLTALAFGIHTAMTPAPIALAQVPSTAPAKAAAPARAAVPANLASMDAAFEQIYNQVSPSVVTINVVQRQAVDNSFAPFFGIPPSQLPQYQYQQALGSGFVWDMQGDIVTNNHVISGASQISVTFADGTTVPGKVIGADPSGDLAVVKVSAPASELHPVQMGDSTTLKVGQLAIAIGNPFGEQNTMTTGIISALGRSLPANPNSQGATYAIPDVIQTDAPINPGNSGGVLLNDQGQVVGVTFQIESQSGSSAGIGFAIPSVIVKQIVPSLIATGHYEHPYLGISGSSLDSALAQAMGLPANQRGALVVSVTPGSPADQAGLQASTRQVTIDGQPALVGGDVITAIDGQPVRRFGDMVAYLARSTKVGQTVTLTILRNGSTETVKVTLAARPSSSAQQSGAGTNQVSASSLA
jgi:S1-C subfamily serine protease